MEYAGNLSIILLSAMTSLVRTLVMELFWIMEPLAFGTTQDVTKTQIVIYITVMKLVSLLLIQELNVDMWIYIGHVV